MLGLRFCVRAFSSCGERGPLFIAVHGPVTVAASPAAEHRLQMCRLSSCGSWAQLLRGMWDLPRPGLEPVFPCIGRQILNHCATREAKFWYKLKGSGPSFFFSFNEKEYSKLKLKEMSVNFKSQICIFIIDLHVHAHTGLKCNKIFLILDHGQNFVSSSAFHTSIHHHHSSPSYQQIPHGPIK